MPTLRAELSGVRIPTEIRDFSLLQIAQTSSEVKPSPQRVQGVFSPGGKDNHSYPPSGEVNGWSFTSVPLIRFHDVVTNFPLPLRVHGCYCFSHLLLLAYTNRNFELKSLPQDKFTHFIVLLFNKKLRHAVRTTNTFNKLLLLLFTTNGLSPGGSGYFTCIQNMKLVTNKFKSGGLHEKHVVATWNLENHLSICL